MKTYLITGGAGFIGSTFVRQLLASSSCRIINLDALTYAGNLGSLQHAIQDKERHVFVKGDIRDRQLVSELLEKYQCSAIVHFAAESHVDRSLENPNEFAETNVMGTLQLLQAALAYWNNLEGEAKDEFRFLHVSTDEVYGSLGDEGKFKETTPYSPNSPYSASKAASDHFVRAYHETFHLPTLMTHCSNNYGPYQFPEKLIPLMILNAVAGKPLPVYGDGKNVRDWIHVEDHCDAIRVVLKKGTPGQTYNVGGNCEKSNLDVVHTICDAVDRLAKSDSDQPSRELIQYVTDRPGHDFRYAIDGSKIEKTLGWIPKTPFETGIEQAVRWYLENKEWVAEVSQKYDGKRLGLSASDSVSGSPDDLPQQEIEGVVFGDIKRFTDDRGWLCELFRHDEIDPEFHPRMAYVSETLPGVARGPHEHVDQADYFAFYGPGDFELYLWDNRESSPTSGNRSVVVVGASNPSTVIIPAGVVHAYKNISPVSGRVVNAPNRLYAGEGKSEPVDEIRHEDTPGSPYSIEEFARAHQKS